MVYLIHFKTPLKAHVNCQHYIGYSKDEETFKRRIECHRKGFGSRYLKFVTEQGIEWEVVRIWPEADGNFERKLKKMKNSKAFCPICNKERYMNNGKFNKEE